jgi:uncharacterized protein (TIGR03382 family)
MILSLASLGILVGGDASAGALAALERIERASGARPLVVWRAGRRAPELVAGRLSAPLAGSPEQAAARFLAAHADLVRAPVAEIRPTAVLRTAQGSVVRYQQVHRGLPVFNASAAVTIDDAGVVRGVAQTTRFVPPQDLTPGIDAAQALRVAQDLSVTRPTANLGRVRLGLYAIGREALLAYRVDLPAVPALLEATTLYLSAHDGRLLRRESRIRFAKQGKVYQPNPVVTPSAAAVDMPWLGTNAVSLETSLVKALNCVDNHTTTQVTVQGFTVNVHLCEELHKARADGSYDFLFDPTETSPARDEDEFAEVQMFYHVNRIYDFYKSLGFTQLIDSTTQQPGQIQATVNFRIPVDVTNPPSNILQAIQQASDPHGPLYPFDNAFFVDAASTAQFLTRDRDSIIFGQGTNADFAYDGDVIYHEFGHAVIGSTSRLAAALIDEFGLDSAPGAMNEGYADYFSAALAGNAKVGEYAGSSLPAGQAAGAIRDLDNTDVCPNHLWGEVHQDSQAFSAALWEVRKGLAAADRPKYDKAVYAAMVGLASESSFEAAATATVEQVRTQVSQAAATSAQAVYQNRGLMGCNNRIVNYTTARRLAFVEGTGTASLSPFVPGYTQLKFTVPSGRNEIVVSYVPGRGLPTPESGFDFGATANLKVLFSQGTAIEFTYAGDTISNASQFPRVTPRDTGRTTTQGKIFEARYSQNVTPGDYYIMVVNEGSGQGVVQSLKVEAASTTTTTDGGTPRPDGGTTPPDAGTGGQPDAGTAPRQSGGGCAAAGGGTPAALLGLLVALAALMLRRRPRA